MKKNAFIIFIKNSGEVKSRIAQEVGREKAIAIYEELLDHTFLLAQKVKSFASIYLYFSEENKDLRWQKIANTFTCFMILLKKQVKNLNRKPT